MCMFSIEASSLFPYAFVEYLAVNSPIALTSSYLVGSNANLALNYQLDAFDFISEMCLL